MRCSGCHISLDADQPVCLACGFPAEPTPRRSVGVADGGSRVVDPSGSAVDAAAVGGADTTDLGISMRAACDHAGARRGAVVCPRCGAALHAGASGYVDAAGMAGSVATGAAALATPAASGGNGDLPEPPYAVLRLPWGTPLVMTPGQSVVVGRESGPLAEQMSQVTTVSRRHATITMTTSGALIVADHASTNGTFVNGVRCLATGSTQVADRAQVSFGRAFVVAIEVVR